MFRPSHGSSSHRPIRLAQVDNASSHARQQCALGAHPAIRPWVRSPSARPSGRLSDGGQPVAQAHVYRSADLGAAGPAFRLVRSALFIVFAARFKISRRCAAGTQLVVVVARSCLKHSELTCGVSASRHSPSQRTPRGADCKSVSGSRPMQQRLVCVEAVQTFSIQRVKVLTPQVSSIHRRLTRGRSLVRSQSGPPHKAAGKGRIFRPRRSSTSTLGRVLWGQNRAKALSAREGAGDRERPRPKPHRRVRRHRDRRRCARSR